MIEIFYFLGYGDFKSWCVRYVYDTSKIELATFLVLNGHMWLTAVVLNWVDLDLELEAKDWIEERRALIFTNLQMCPQKGFPFGIFKVVSHQKIQKCRCFIPGWANLRGAALQNLIAKCSTHIYPSFEKGWGKLKNRKNISKYVQT